MIATRNLSQKNMAKKIILDLLQEITTKGMKMDRRALLKGAVASLAATTLISETTLAGTTAQPPMAGGLYYNRENPGRWAKKVNGHMPVLEKQGSGADTTIQVTTGHEMKDYEHYIVKHVLLDENFQYVDEYMFDPIKEKAPISKFKVGEKKGKFYALSVCNKHDTWMDSITV